MTGCTRMRRVAGLLALFAMIGATAAQAEKSALSLGPRPLFLVDELQEGALKRELQQCAGQPVERTDFSISHRGAPLQFPEHTRESYLAAVRMGAGIVECDVTFTKDQALVCRHAQCDLHTTTNILAVPHLAATCAVPFTPARFDPKTGERIRAATARCCTSDITLAEFQTLCGKMDGFDPDATTVAAFLRGTPPWRTDLHAGCGTLMSHAQSIRLFKTLGVKMTPELKTPAVPMPYAGGYTQQHYAQHLVDEYKAAGVSPDEVFLQSFSLDDVRYWIEHEPAFGRQAVYLDARPDGPGFVPGRADFEALVAQGVRIVAPPIWALVALDEDGRIVPSAYARLARDAGLDIIAWTLERTGPVHDMVAEGRQYYFQRVTAAMEREGDVLTVLDVLAREVGVLGVFSDWPATVTYYANCTQR